MPYHFLIFLYFVLCSSLSLPVYLSPFSIPLFISVSVLLSAPANLIISFPTCVCFIFSSLLLPLSPRFSVSSVPCSQSHVQRGVNVTWHGSWNELSSLTLHGQTTDHQICGSVAKGARLFPPLKKKQRISGHHNSTQSLIVSDLKFILLCLYRVVVYFGPGLFTGNALKSSSSVQRQCFKKQKTKTFHISLSPQQSGSLRNVKVRDPLLVELKTEDTDGN